MNQVQKWLFNSTCTCIFEFHVYWRMKVISTVALVQHNRHVFRITERFEIILGRNVS